MNFLLAVLVFFSLLSLDINPADKGEEPFGSLTILPFEMLLRITSYCDNKTIINMKNSCKYSQNYIFDYIGEVKHFSSEQYKYLKIMDNHIFFFNKNNGVLIDLNTMTSIGDVHNDFSLTNTFLFSNKNYDILVYINKNKLTIKHIKKDNHEISSYEDKLTKFSYIKKINNYIYLSNKKGLLVKIDPTKKMVFSYELNKLSRCKVKDIFETKNYLYMVGTYLKYNMLHSIKKEKQNLLWEKVQSYKIYKLIPLGGDDIDYKKKLLPFNCKEYEGIIYIFHDHKMHILKDGKCVQEIPIKSSNPLISNKVICGFDKYSIECLTSKQEIVNFGYNSNAKIHRAKLFGKYLYMPFKGGGFSLVKAKQTLHYNKLSPMAKDIKSILEPISFNNILYLPYKRVSDPTKYGIMMVDPKTRKIIYNVNVEYKIKDFKIVNNELFTVFKNRYGYIINISNLDKYSLPIMGIY